MNSNIKIKTAKSSDVPAILEIFDSWYPNNWDKDIAKQYYEKFFNNHDSCTADKVFILCQKREIIGVTGYCPAQVEAVSDICWLNWFYIHKDKTGHSHGRDLLLYVINKLKKKSFRKLYIDTTNNIFYTSARKLYEQLGFTLEATLLDYYGNEENKLIYGFNLTGSNVQACCQRE